MPGRNIDAIEGAATEAPSGTMAGVGWTDQVMGVYPVAAGAMVHALAHDLEATNAAFDRCVELLEDRGTGAVREALDGWREALDAGRWPQVSTRLWQLMCSLPVGFPPDQGTLPPPAGDVPVVLLPCPEHGSAPDGVWWRFCPRCGAQMFVGADQKPPA